MQPPPPDTVLIAQAVGDTLSVQSPGGDAASTLEILGILLGSIGTLGVALLGYLRYHQESSTHEDIFYERRLEAAEKLVDHMGKMTMVAAMAGAAEGEAKREHLKELEELYLDFHSLVRMGAMYLAETSSLRVIKFQLITQSALKDNSDLVEKSDAMGDITFEVIGQLREVHGLPDLTDKLKNRFG